MTKRIGSILLFIVLFMGVAVAQQSQQNNDQTDKTVSIPESMLTPQQKATLQVQSVKSWSGIGHEIGTAVNESLKAVTSNTSDFAKTDVGKLTVAIVIWKVIGDQAIHVFFGILFPAIWIPLWIWSYRAKCMPRQVLVRVLPDKTKEYKTINIKNDGYSDDMSAASVAHTIGAILLIIITLFIIFSY